MWIVDDAKHVSESSGLLFFSSSVVLPCNFSFYLVVVYPCMHSIAHRVAAIQLNYSTMAMWVSHITTTSIVMTMRQPNIIRIYILELPLLVQFVRMHFLYYSLSHRSSRYPWMTFECERILTYVPRILPNRYAAIHRERERERASWQNIPVSCLLTCNENRKKWINYLEMCAFLFSNSRKTYGYIEHGTRDTP